MVELKGSRFTSLLPSSLASQPEVRAIAYAVSRQVDKLIERAGGAQILCGIDEMPDEVLDYLALEKRTPSYNENYSIETKRKLIKDTLLTYLQMGTPASVNRTIETIYGAGAIEEWFEYEGEPHYFRLYIDITDSAQRPMVAYDAPAVTETISETKRMSSWLETLSYSITHKITIGAGVWGIKYNVPECGTLRCGTWWRSATLGYSAGQALYVGAQTEAWAVAHKLCGTLPYAATLGYSADNSIAASAGVSGYAMNAAQAGDGTKTGTKPWTATAGYSAESGVAASAGVSGYAAEAAQAGDGTETGTRPMAATTGYSGTAALDSGAAVLGYTATPAVCGAVRCGTGE